MLTSSEAGDASTPADACAAGAANAKPLTAAAVRATRDMALNKIRPSVDFISMA